MYNDYLLYKKRLEQTLNTVRAEFMGQNEKLTEHIPDSANMSAEVLADQIAHQLLFRLHLVTDITDVEIGDSRRWLGAAALFLLVRCPETDHTFGQLIKLANTDSKTLAQLNFSGWPAHYSKDLANVPRAVKVGLEAVIWRLVKPQVSRLELLEETVLQLL